MGDLHKLFVNNKPFGTYDQAPGRELQVDGGLDKAKNARFSVGEHCQGVYIYIVLPSNNPFASFTDHFGDSVAVHVTKDRQVKHDQLARGQNVRYAGTVEFDRGQLVRWCNGSGHYLPDANCAHQAPKVFPMKKFGWVVNDHARGAFWSWEGKIWYRQFTSDDAYEFIEASDQYLNDRGIRTKPF